MVKILYLFDVHYRLLMTNYWNIFREEILPWLVKIFRRILLSIVHLVLLGEYLLVVRAVVEHEVGDHKAGQLLLFTEVDQHITQHLQNLTLPGLSLGPQLLFLQVSDAAVWTSIEMPVMKWNSFYNLLLYFTLNNMSLI